MDPFTVLGVSPSASEDDIRKAFRKKAMQYVCSYISLWSSFGPP